MNRFESGAAELRAIKDKMDEGFRRRKEGAAHVAAWHKSGRELMEKYDVLAFPGGLGNELTLLAQGDIKAVEMAVQYFEADPWYYRSGYNKEKILKVLSKQSLSLEQQQRLRQVVLSRVRRRIAGREMQAYARLGPKISNAEFEAELKDIFSNSNQTAARNANFVLNCIRSARGK